MDNQTPAIGIINPAFTAPLDEKDQYGTTSMGQTVLPPYCPNAGHQIPMTNPNPSGYPNQPYRAPDGPQDPYNHSGMSAYPQAMYVGQTGVTVQPTVVVTPMPVVTAVPDYLFYSIFTMVFCFLPLGIAAIVYSLHTQNANLTGQRELAMQTSRVALILNNVAVGLGITFIIVGIVVTFTI